MFRIAVIFAFALAACDVGDASMKGMTMVDSGSGSNTAQCVNPLTPDASHTHNAPVNAGNPTNAGLNCLAANCHNAGGAGGQYQFAGTLYTTTGGTTPSTGATIRVVAGGQTYSAVTDDKGNFHYAGSNITWGVT